MSFKKETSNAQKVTDGILCAQNLDIHTEVFSYSFIHTYTQMHAFSDDYTVFIQAIFPPLLIHRHFEVFVCFYV